MHLCRTGITCSCNKCNAINIHGFFSWFLSLSTEQGYYIYFLGDVKLLQRNPMVGRYCKGVCRDSYRNKYSKHKPSDCIQEPLQVHAYDD